MYNDILRLSKQGNIEGIAKELIRYFPMVKDKEIEKTNTRYCIFKISDNNKFKYAGFKKIDGNVINTLISTKEIDFINLI
jgi:hypothetical protein